MFADVAPGEYAVSVFHDENSNGKLDRNFMGMPKEGVGASDDAVGHFGPPKYDDARFSYKGGRSVMAIHVKYLAAPLVTGEGFFRLRRYRQSRLNRSSSLHDGGGNQITPFRSGREQSQSEAVLLDSEGGGLDSVHPEGESWGVGVGDAFAADFLGEAGQAI